MARVLHDAMAEGRLTVAELDERLAGLYQAKTFGDLEPFTRDLPTARAAAPQVPGVAASSQPDLVGGTAGSAVAFAIMGEVKRTGNWVVPAHFAVSAFWGGARLDLREARFEQRECTIQAIAIMGGIDIIVPPELTVHIDGIGIMGGFDSRAAGEGDPNGPVLRVTGLALMAGVDVRRKPRRSDRKKITP